jgi:hypothetical protein
MSKSRIFAALLLGINDAASMFRSELMKLEEGAPRTLRFVDIMVNRQLRRLAIDPKAADAMAQLQKLRETLSEAVRDLLAARVKAASDTLTGGAKKAA